MTGERLVRDSALQAPLAWVGVGSTVRVVAVEGDRDLRRRCLSLGLRPGSELRVLHRRGQGIVVSRRSGASDRLALRIPSPVKMAR